MNPTTAHTADNTTDPNPVIVVRHAIETLNSLDSETADHLNALAFVLMRIARADGRVCTHERDRMEEILVEHARVSPEHAALVTEIACHRTQLADCGKTYSISRGLRERLDDRQRESVLDLLAAVAEADGRFCTLEHRELDQIAAELGLEA